MHYKLTEVELTLPLTSLELAAGENGAGVLVRRKGIGVNLSDIVAGGAQPRPSSEGRCIRRFQLYRMSPPTDFSCYGAR
jgi:hypothetical protein